MLVSFMTAYWGSLVVLGVLTFILHLTFVPGGRIRSAVEWTWTWIVRVLYGVVVVGAFIGLWIPVFIPGLY